MHGGQDRGDVDLRQTEPTNYTIYVTILSAKHLGTQKLGFIYAVFKIKIYIFSRYMYMSGQELGWCQGGMFEQCLKPYCLFGTISESTFLIRKVIRCHLPY